jgi:hypothetical protein
MHPHHQGMNLYQMMQQRMNQRVLLCDEPRDNVFRGPLLQDEPRDASLPGQDRIQSLLRELSNDSIHDIWIANYREALHQIYRSRGVGLRRGYNVANPSVSDWYERQRNSMPSMAVLKRELLREIELN